MSYQVIARKWRPQAFDEVTGQDIVTHSLRNAIEFDRLHHAYLFSGARGVGKTTTARILAKALNCHRSDKPTVTPCRYGDPDACASCIEIAESRSMDVLEIDAASHTGIDDVRGTILEGINVNPARDRYKIFIIDEVHQLSKAAFNALLKTLEEPPGNVLFVMATTELHKVPETITSRCQEFQFRTIPIAKIFDRLKLIAEADKITVSDDALREIARSGMGSMRDAQSNFDQVISFSGPEIDVADVTKALGFASSDVLARVVRAIASSDAKTVLETVDDLVARGHDLRNFCRDLLGLVRDLMVNKVAAGSEQLFDSAVFTAAELTEMGAPFTEADLLRLFNSLCLTEASLREAAQPRYVLEVGLVRLTQLAKVSDIEDILEKLNAVSGGSSAASAAAGNAGVEKKTLKSEPVAPPSKAPVVPIPVKEPETEPESPADFAVEPPSDEIGLSETIENAFFAEEPIERPAAVVPISAYLPPIPSSELEHVDDPKLDALYEAALRYTGDDLRTIPEAGRLAESITESVGEHAAAAAASSGRTNVRRAKVDLASFMPASEDENAQVPIPELGDDPTADELIAYANALPLVRLTKQIFRADVVEARKL